MSLCQIPERGLRARPASQAGELAHVPWEWQVAVAAFPASLILEWRGRPASRHRPAVVPVARPRPRPRDRLRRGHGAARGPPTSRGWHRAAIHFSKRCVSWRGIPRRVLPAAEALPPLPAEPSCCLWPFCRNDWNKGNALSEAETLSRCVAPGSGTSRALSQSGFLPDPPPDA